MFNGLFLAWLVIQIAVVEEIKLKRVTLISVEVIAIISQCLGMKA